MNFTIQPVSFGEARYDQTASLAKHCSFQGSGQYLCELMADNAFTDFERVFCAVSNGKVIGFCGLMQESCCEDTRTPWLDFVFVGEPYRGHGVAREMIDTVKRYAQELGFPALYLCTSSSERYYERLGFTFVAEAQINECTLGKIMKIELLH